MKEVVKKELLKWLDEGIVYAISDSKWVSPTQCVSKKGGLIVVEKDKNELILTFMRCMTVIYEIHPFLTYAFKRMSFGLCKLLRHLWDT